MRFNVYFTLHNPGTGRTMEVPNAENPVRCANLESLLDQLKGSLPSFGFGLCVVGVRVGQVSDDLITLERKNESGSRDGSDAGAATGGSEPVVGTAVPDSGTDEGQ